MNYVIERLQLISVPVNFGIGQSLLMIIIPCLEDRICWFICGERSGHVRAE
jgi:hypothetical protein